MKKRTTKDALMDYICIDKRGGPVLGPELEAIAVTRFGRTPTSLTARLRELREGKYLSQTKAQMGNSDRRFVAYSCTREQYHAYRVMRTSGGASGAASKVAKASSPPASNGAASPRADEEMSLFPLEPPGHWKHR